jgi:predicted secreted acid phosphatase
MKKSTLTISLLFPVFISASISGCVTTSNEQENLDATLWVQTSSEFPAVTIGTYSAATAALQRIVADGLTDVNRMAVVMDVDETVLDTYTYMALWILGNVDYVGETWDQWMALRVSTAIPGAVDFIRTSQESGLSLFFITNRDCLVRAGNSGDCPQKEDTFANLRQLGVETDLDHIFLRGERPPNRCLSILTDAEHEEGRWTSVDKTSRRQCVELDHDIVMLVGDQLSDFIGGLEGTTPETRKVLLQQYGEKWGDTWFMLPNPTYGYWLDLLQPDKRSYLREW